MTTKGPDMTGPAQWQDVTGPTQWQPGGASSPPLAGTPGASPRTVRPGRAWYLVALAVFLGGAALLVAGLLGVKGQVDGFQRVPLPQGGQVTLGHNSYVLYYEAPGAASGQIPNFNVTVTPASAGARAKSLQPYAADVTYSLGSRQGRAVLTLQLSHPGTFRVVATGAPTVAGGSDLAFGSNIVGGIADTVVSGGLLMVLGVAGGITLFVIRYVRTSRRRAQARLPMGPWPGPQAGSAM